MYVPSFLPRADTNHSALKTGSHFIPCHYTLRHLLSNNLLASAPQPIHNTIGTIAIMTATRLTASARYPSDVMAISIIPSFVIARDDANVFSRRVIIQII